MALLITILIVQNFAGVGVDDHGGMAAAARVGWASRPQCTAQARKRERKAGETPQQNA